MELPPNLKMRGILSQGAAFKATGVQGDKGRYYFVLNISPVTDEVLVLATSTTRFEEHAACKGGDDVHIPISKDEYSCFTEHCLICCNGLVRKPKAKVMAILQGQQYELLPPLPEGLWAKILTGVENSPVIPPAIKRMVLGEED